ncbi:MAG: IS66 family transposase [Magnetococcales bacterium]|nr:IS66 family transposase [Magnetococcales bacterium]
MDTRTNLLPSELPNDPIILREMVVSLSNDNKELERRYVQLEHIAAYLRGQLNILTAKRFGRSSEKSGRQTPEVDCMGMWQPSLFDEAETTAATSSDADEAEEEAPAQRTKPRKKKPGRKPLPSDLPRIDIVHDLTDAEKVCALDGSTLVEIGREYSEQLDIIPAKVQVIRNVQVKYGCPHCHQGVKTTPMPPRIIPKAMASASTLAHIVVAKYADGLPLYRQSGMLVRAGIDLPRSTLANWMIKAGQAVQPLVNLLRDHLLDYGVVQMDETTVQVLKEPDRLATSKSYMWVQKGGPPDKPIILFDYNASRAGVVPKELLLGFKGYLQTDGYTGYHSVASNPDIVHVGCMAHARRKFDESIKALGTGGWKKPGKAGEALALIGRLYAIEKDLREKQASPETRHARRQEHAKPILDELKTWANKTVPTVPPKTALGVALGYLLGHWPRLIRYLNDGRLEIDNNAVENAIRPFVIGRKGWLFSDSVRGVKSSANLYSLIETAKTNGLEPFAYLRYLFTQLPTAATVDDYENLLPWNVDKASLSTN